MLRYRSLFDELLRPEGDGAAGTMSGQVQPAGDPEIVAGDGAGTAAADPEHDNQGTGPRDGR